MRMCQLVSYQESEHCSTVEIVQGRRRIFWHDSHIMQECPKITGITSRMKKTALGETKGHVTPSAVFFVLYLLSRQKNEQRAAVWFCFLFGENFVETILILETAYKEDVIRETEVYEWFARFKKSDLSINEKLRSDVWIDWIDELELNSPNFNGKFGNEKGCCQVYCQIKKSIELKSVKLTWWMNPPCQCTGTYSHLCSIVFD